MGTSHFANVGGIDTFTNDGAGGYNTNFRAGSYSVGTFAPPSGGLNAQSLFLDTAQVAPLYGTPTVLGTSLPDATIEWQGADDDGLGAPDLATLTAWSTNITTINGKQHIRFRVLLSGVASPLATIDLIEVPITW